MFSFAFMDIYILYIRDFLFAVYTAATMDYLLVCTKSVWDRSFVRNVIVFLLTCQPHIPQNPRLSRQKLGIQYERNSSYTYNVHQGL